MSNYPAWLKKKVPKSNNNKKMRELIGDEEIHTVCESALCPNRGECFNKGTVTFMILGDVCTRNCRFCAVETTHSPLSDAQVDPSVANATPPLEKGRKINRMFLAEPERVARIAKKLGLKHVVITSVTRDDLIDGGAEQFAKTITAVKEILPEATVEVLTPDFQGSEKALDLVFKAYPDVFNHNVETIERLYSEVRPQADFKQSLAVLKYAKEHSFAKVKSGFMLGLGETEAEVKELLRLLKEAGVDIVTIGQYIAPSKEHYPVKEFVHPDKFEEYKKYGEQELGIKYVFAGPFVRSSYMAGDVLSAIKVSPTELCW